MSTATIPAPTDDALTALRELLAGESHGPATMWSASCTGPGLRIFTSGRLAAGYIADETRRRVRAGNPEPVTVHRLDGGMEPDWDASSDVADVLTATGWTTRCTDPAYAVAWLLRDDVAELLEAILVSAD
jgi:hypothetical protein